MFQRISNSWQLVKASAAVLRADKELLIFPVISAVGTIIVTLTFLLPMILAGFFDLVVVVFVLLAISLGLVNSALSGIYAAAVFNYASEGKAGAFFDEDLVRHAFRAK